MVVLVLRFQARLGMARLRVEGKRMSAMESTSRMLGLFLSRMPKQSKAICGGRGRAREG
jgi:hypothetical protein